MDFLKEKQRVLYINLKYSKLLGDLASKVKLKNQQMIALCTMIGYKKGLKEDYIPTSENGEFQTRTNYLNTFEDATLYSIMLLDDFAQKDIFKLNDEENEKIFASVIESYANGGAKYLLEQFEDNIINGEFDSTYTDYVFDFAKLLSKEIEEVPF